jgi:DMSO/TMAO reductase YedYZ heme-binding membrane subunit
MSSQLFWYSARAGGIVGWALLSASVIWGLCMSTRVMGKLAKRPWLLDLHRYLGGLAVIFTGVHVASIIADSYVHFGLVEVLVPFASSWKPLPVAWGIISLYLLLAVEVTSLVRNRLSRRVWHMVHLTSLPLFAFSTIHMLTAGTDGGNGALRVAMVATGAAVAALTTLRVIQVLEPPPPAPEARRISRPAPVRIRG